MPKISRKPPKRYSAPLITFLIIILVGILYMAWSYLSGSLPWQFKQDVEEPQITLLEKEPEEKEIDQQVETSPPEQEREATLHLTQGETQDSPALQNECRQTADKILLFFEHLDNRDYILKYAIKGSAHDHFRGIINKLIANPPVVVRETDDLFAILNNLAHFFRILGPKEILLLKDVLTHERENIEPTMALFYKWSEIAPDCSDSNLDIDLPLAGLYEYAGYFINTLGGQSYLFRREPYLRTLIRYYSTLIIDRANSADANRYGIDIRYTLNSLIAEIQGNSTLIYQQEYLEMLLLLQENYQEKYGSNCRYRKKHDADKYTNCNNLILPDGAIAGWTYNEYISN